MTIIEEITKEYNRYLCDNEFPPRYIVMTMDKYDEFIAYVDLMKNLRVGYQCTYFQGALILPTSGANGTLIKAFS